MEPFQTQTNEGANRAGLPPRVPQPQAPAWVLAWRMLEEPFHSLAALGKVQIGGKTRKAAAPVQVGGKPGRGESNGCWGKVPQTASEPEIFFFSLKNKSEQRGKKVARSWERERSPPPLARKKGKSENLEVCRSTAAARCLKALLAQSEHSPLQCHTSSQTP